VLLLEDEAADGGTTWEKKGAWPLAAGDRRGVVVWSDPRREFVGSTGDACEARVCDGSRDGGRDDPFPPECRLPRRDVGGGGVDPFDEVGFPPKGEVNEMPGLVVAVLMIWFIDEFPVLELFSPGGW
jgi:hypothetical protein